MVPPLVWFLFPSYKSISFLEHLVHSLSQGVFLKAFVGINENSTMMEEEPASVNIAKLRMISVQSRELQRMQLTPYNLIPVKKMLLCRLLSIVLSSSSLTIDPRILFLFFFTSFVRVPPAF